LRIERLSITGFGPFRETQDIDFAAFNNDLFLITGKTGAGKSSILDAICFALYGDIPRYEKTESSLRSDFCEPDDPTEIVLEFSLGDERYRVNRIPEYERPAKRGGGMTKQLPKATLEKFDGEKYVGVTAQVRETNQALAGILKLSKEQFLQVILLAQGRFQEFLKAKSEERLPVLRSLFETSRFELLEKKLDDKRKVLETAVAAAQAVSAGQRELAAELLQLDDEDELPDAPEFAWYAEQLAVFAERLAEATAAAGTADADSTAASTELTALRELDRQQRERAAAELKLAQLASSTDEIASDTASIAAHERGLPVMPQLAVHTTASLALAAGEEALAEALTDPDLVVPAPADAAAARKLEQKADKDLGSLDAALEEEATAPALAVSLEEAETKLVAATQTAKKASDRSAAIPALIAAANAELGNLGAAGALEPAARITVAQVESSLKAANLAVAARAKVAKQSTLLLAASEADAAATTLHSDLLHRQLAGYASVLASNLVDGDACPVCGSTAHPSLAESDDSTVTQEHVDKAKAAMDARRRDFEAASAKKTELDSEVAGAEGSSGGRSVDDLDAELRAANAALVTAEGAAASAEKKRAELATLETESAAAAQEASETVDTVATARTSRDDLLVRFNELAKRLTSARGEFETVRERADFLESRRDALATLRVAFEEVIQLRASETAALKLVESLLEESGFATADAAGAAHLESGQLATVSERVRKHQADTDATRGVLATLFDAPTEPVEVGVATERATLASAARDRARDAQNAVLLAERGFAKLVEDVRTAGESSAKLVEEYGLVRNLAATVAGKLPNTKSIKLETYVLAAELEDIVAAANQRLAVMTSGRYVLQHDDKVEYRNVRGGLGLEVLDQYSGRVRATHSLSGGESFLASLALALGLAEVVSARSGAVKLDTLFIDEGFGSLDSDTLELAMTTLDNLRAGGRTVGIISHVEAMKEQIHSQLRVEAGKAGSSRIAS
jgi:exonuclease SbcC